MALWQGLVQCKHVDVPNLKACFQRTYSVACTHELLVQLRTGFGYMLKTILNYTTLKYHSGSEAHPHWANNSKILVQYPRMLHLSSIN